MQSNKSCNKRGTKGWWQEHATFLFPFFVTISFGFIFVTISYYLNDKNVSYYHLAIESFVPSIITYVLCESIHNLIVVFSQHLGQYIWTLSALIAIVIFESVYLIYVISDAFEWSIATIIFAIVLLVFNILSYREVCLATYNKHGLT